MSEFSDSYHLRTGNHTEAATLLKSAGVPGLIIPTDGPWVTFVAPPEDESLILSHNMGLLVHYWFGEDHGCWINIHDGTNRLVRLAYESEDDEAMGIVDNRPGTQPQDRGEALEILVRLGLIESAAEIILSTLEEQVPRKEWGPTVAASLQLGPVSWLDWRGVLANKEYVCQSFPGAYFVDAQ